MLREIESILREIAKSQGIEIPEQRQAESPRKLSAAGRPSYARDDDEVVDAEAVIEAEPLREDLVSHVRRHMDTTDITGHASRLGEQIGLADDKLEARLHRTFDHDLGRLRSRDEELAEQRASADVAGDIVAMFRSPANIRQAIIMTEILTPRTDRW